MATRRRRSPIPICISTSTSLPMAPMICWFRAAWDRATIPRPSRSIFRTDRNGMAGNPGPPYGSAKPQVRRGMLKLKGISKSFPGVRALSGVDLEVKPGEIHGLLGENGAGKSTLIKIVAGAYAPDRGEMLFEGAPVRWSSPREAQQRGVQVVYQEFALFPQLSVAENIFVGHERRNRFGIVDHGRTRREAREVLERLGVSLDPRASVASLSVADQQMVEIARAMVQQVKLLVLDEPTAVIAGREVSVLFERLRRLRASGVSVICISHHLEEVFAICARVTVMK